MVGEIRDAETAEIAIQAALTGHLVFSTLHTNDSSGAITRLVDMGIEPFLVASSVIAVLAQRLVRRVCPTCRDAVPPVGRGAAPARHLGRRPRGPTRSTAPARAARTASSTGYRGRLGIHELLVIDDEVRNLTMKAADSASIRRVAAAKGMNTLREDGAEKVLAGRPPSKRSCASRRRIWSEPAPARRGVNLRPTARASKAAVGHAGLRVQGAEREGSQRRRHHRRRQPKSARIKLRRSGIFPTELERDARRSRRRRGEHAPGGFSFDLSGLFERITPAGSGADDAPARDPGRRRPAAGRVPRRAGRAGRQPAAEEDPVAGARARGRGRHPGRRHEGSTRACSTIST